jgi:hypothetical protein
MKLTQDRRHHGLLNFIRKVIDVPAGISKEQLISFRSVASREYPSVVPIIDEYIKLAERSDTDDPKIDKTNRKVQQAEAAAEMHLFDLLRDKRLFVSNNELATFAATVLSDIKSSHRFDKMSRSDIAARIIEHLESKDQRTREKLEASMREAASTTVKPSERRSFLSKWEQIIKGIDL